MNPGEVFRDRMPRHAFATDDLTHGLHLYEAAEAVRRALLQFNARHSFAWLAFDIDRPTAAIDWEDRHAPAPNLVMVNRDNGHAHLLYGLENPVHNYNEAKPKPQRYLAAIDCALCDKLEADPGYSKLLCKNPLHDRWIVLYPRSELYDLGELADWVDLSKYKDARRRLPMTGLGRNCTLFELLRLWSYRERRQPWLTEDYFREAVLVHALAINAGFNPPLPHSEVRSTARSVARWTWRRMSAEGFQAHQTRLSRLAAASRTEKALERRAGILEAVRQCPELTREDIAALCGVSRRTVFYALRGGVQAPISDKDLSSTLNLIFEAIPPEASLDRA